MIIKKNRAEEVLLLQTILNDFEKVLRKYKFKTTIYISNKEIELNADYGIVNIDIKDMGE